MDNFDFDERIFPPLTFTRLGKRNQKSETANGRFRHLLSRVLPLWKKIITREGDHTKSQGHRIRSQKDRAISYILKGGKTIAS
jgi:hypothetical protein